MTSFPLKSLALTGAFLLAQATFIHSAIAQDFPSKPVSLITPFSAGSGPDVVLRLIAEKLTREWGQRVLVENRPGANGMIAMDAVRKAAPDGYTLLQLDSEQIAALPHLYKQRTLDTLKVFEPIAGLFQVYFLVAVPADSPWKSMKDLIDAAKTKPLNYGSWSIGGPGHLGGVLLETRTDTHMQHVPFKEVSQLYAAVGNNDVNWAYGSLASSQAAFKYGKIKYLAVASPKRIAAMPDVPTMGEAGGPAGLEVSSFVTLLVPRGTPANISARIHEAVNKTLADPEVRARFDTVSFEPIPWTGAEILTRLDAKSQQYSDLIKRANVTLD